MLNLFGYLLAVFVLCAQGITAKDRAPIITVDRLPFEAVWGSNREEAIQYIWGFQKDDFEVCAVPECGSFYCDWIDDVIKNEVRHGKQWKSYLKHWIKQYAAPGSVVIDVGAHIGTQTMVMAKAVGRNGLVVVFEPQYKLFRELFWNVYLNEFRNVRFFCCGAGNRDGTIELSPLRYGNEGATPLLGGTGKVVPVLPIDSLRLTNVSLIKISVVGQEEQVLDGAVNTIATNRPVILLEIVDFPGRVLKMLSSLESMGYRVYHLKGLDYLALPIE